MRMLYYFMQYDTPMFLWQNHHIVEELAHHNIEVKIFNPLHYPSIEIANSKVLEEVRENKYDLFMTCDNETICYTDTLQQLKKIGIPTLLICFDNLVAPFLHKNNCKYFDCVWLTSEENQGMYQRWGAKTIVLPYAANPYVLTFRENPEICKVGFIGSPYGSRANMINALLSNEIPVDIYTSKRKDGGSNSASAHRKDSWKLLQTAMLYLHYPAGRKLLRAVMKNKFSKDAVLDTQSAFLTMHDAVGFDKMSQLYSAYCLSLSSTTARNTGILKNPLEIVNLRAFEVPMCGGIQFCRRTTEIMQYFEDGKEILLFNDDAEMVDKAKFYLRPEQEKKRMEIRVNARRRAEAEHTWYCRFSKAFEKMGIRNK